MPLRDALKVAYATQRGRMLRLYLKQIARHVTIRNGMTDLRCLQKVFVDEEYRLPFELRPRLIVDAGANIGMATIYFSHHYPDAQIVAIEPETANFELLRRNCVGLPNVILIQGALWPENRKLAIKNPTADSWTFRVAECNAESATSVDAITIADVLERAGASHIDLLKIDIEGAELPLFSTGAKHWIDQVGTIAIELHDHLSPGCAQAFYSLLTTRQFVQQIRGENVFVKILVD
jgi:FkbM family methyltransferase